MNLDDIKELTNNELQTKILALALEEKKLEIEFMKTGLVVFERSIHLVLGYSSLPEYMDKHLGLSRAMAFA